MKKWIVIMLVLFWAPLVAGCSSDPYRNVDFSQPAIPKSLGDVKEDSVPLWMNVPGLPGIIIGDSEGCAIKLNGVRWFGNLPLISEYGIEGDTITVPIELSNWVRIIPPDTIYEDDEWGRRYWGSSVMFIEQDSGTPHYHHLRVSGVKGEITFFLNHGVDLSGDTSQVSIDYFDEDYNHLVISGGGPSPISVRPDEAGLEITGLQGQYTVEKKDRTGSVQSSDSFIAVDSCVRVLW